MIKEFKYETPFMEIIYFRGNDVITGSTVEEGVTMPEDGWTDED